MTDKKKETFLDKKMSRRDFLKTAGVTGAGAIIGSSALGSFLGLKVSSEKQKNLGEEQLSFYGNQQSGIISPQQSNCYFVVLDLATSNKEEVKELFKEWTTYAAKLMAGENLSEESESANIAPTDTGETEGLNPYRLSLTFGISRQALETLGLKDKIPSEFKDLPAFPGEQLEEDHTGGDLMIQACADDEQVAFHAVRNLVRKGRSKVTMRWSQSGFVAIGNRKETPRNLFGFKDGTANETNEQGQDNFLWCTDNNWLKGGTYMTVRRIRMHLETWDRTNLHEQENTFGRYKKSGAPFGETAEFAKVDISKKDENGEPVMPVDSHVHLAKKTGVEMHRRSYSYSDGINAKTGQFESGLLFISYQKSPEQFSKVQTMLGSVDKLNEYITHIGSGLFAIFPGVKEGGYIGQELFK